MPWRRPEPAARR